MLLIFTVVRIKAESTDYENLQTWNIKIQSCINYYATYKFFEPLKTCLYIRRFIRIFWFMHATLGI